MKNLLILFLFLISCSDAGTLIKVDKGNNPEIEVYKYYFDKGEFVYVSRFKDSPNIVTTTWQQQVSNTQRVTKANIILYQKDSIK